MELTQLGEVVLFLVPFVGISLMIAFLMNLLANTEADQEMRSRAYAKLDAKLLWNNDLKRYTCPQCNGSLDTNSHHYLQCVKCGYTHIRLVKKQVFRIKKETEKLVA